MRAISADTDAILTAPQGYATFVRVRVADFTSALVDLTTYAGYNMVLGVNYQDDVDSPGQTATVFLRREVYELSLSPLKETSPLNLAFQYPGVYSALIDIARRIEIEVAVVPHGEEPVSWMSVFSGFIDEVQFGADPIELHCRDQIAPLIDRPIEDERVYGFDDGGVGGTGAFGLNVWQPSKAYALGQKVLPQQGRRNGVYYDVVTAGTSGASEPTWPTTFASFSSGSVVLQRFGIHPFPNVGRPLIQVVLALLADNGFSSVAVGGDVPSWSIKVWQQQRVPVYEAIKALTDQLGWGFRFEYSDLNSQWELTIRNPIRSKTTPDRTFGPNQTIGFRRMALKIEGIRNAIRVFYSDSQDTDTSSRPKRKDVFAIDANSVIKYGRKYMEIAESDTSQIDTAAEANALASGVLSDLSFPNVDTTAEILYFPHCQLGDLYTFQPDNIRFTSPITAAVIGYAHEITGNQARTTLQLRGKPSAGYKRWLAKDARIRPADKFAVTLANAWAPVTVTAKPTVGGAKLSYGSDEGKLSPGTQLEIHVSKQAGFAASKSTLAWQGSTKTATLSELEPGETYYARFVTKSTDGDKSIISEPSEPISFVAGRALAGHLNPQVGYGYFPPNPSFEHQSRDPLVQMPDHWEVAPGTTYGVDVDSYVDAARGRTIRFKGTANICRFQSALFPIQQGSRFGRVVLNKSPAGNTAIIRLRVQFFVDDVTPSTTAEQVIDFSSVGAAFWRAFVDQPVDANFARLVIEKAPAQPATNLLLYSVYFESGVAAGVPFENFVGQNSWSPDVRTAIFPGAHGVLVLKGQFTKGTAPTANEVMANLPNLSGVPSTVYCANETRRFVVPVNATTGVIEINQTQIRYISGPAGTYFVDGVSFPYNALWPFN